MTSVYTHPYPTHPSSHPYPTHPSSHLPHPHPNPYPTYPSSHLPHPYPTYPPSHLPYPHPNPYPTYPSSHLPHPHPNPYATYPPSHLPHPPSHLSSPVSRNSTRRRQVAFEETPTSTVEMIVGYNLFSPLYHDDMSDLVTIRNQDIIDLAKLCWDTDVAFYILMPDDPASVRFEVTRHMRLYDNHFDVFRNHCQNNNVLVWSNLRLYLLDLFRKEDLFVTLEMLDWNEQHVYRLLYYCYCCVWANHVLYKTYPERLMNAIPSVHPYAFIYSSYLHVNHRLSMSSGDRFPTFWFKLYDLLCTLCDLHWKL